MPQEYVYTKKFQEGVHFEQESQFAEPPHSLKDATEPDHLVRLSQLGGGGGGGDSLWTKDGTTIRPSLGENILLGTPLGAAAAKIHLKGESQVFEIMEPDNYGTDYEVLQAGLGKADRFYRGYGRFDGADGSPRPNIVYVEGYNTAPAGGRNNVDDAGFGFRWETSFSGWFEFHLPEVYAKNGNWYRLMSFYVDKQTGMNNAEMLANSWLWRGYVNPLEKAIELNPQGSRIQINEQLDGYDSTVRLELNSALSYGHIISFFNGLRIGAYDRDTGLVDTRGLFFNSSYIQLEGSVGNPAINQFVFADYRVTHKGTSIIGNGIGLAEVAHASSVLELKSTTKGFLPTRMTGAQAEAIAPLAEGLLVYSFDGSGATINSKGWWGYEGATWVKLN